MNEAFRRIRECVTHLEAIDNFFYKHDSHYKYYRDQIIGMGKFYNSFCKFMYEGNFKRHYQLADLLTFILISRGVMWAKGTRGHNPVKLENYMRIILCVINQLLLQEHITYFPPLRKEFMNYLENQDLHLLIENEKYKSYYSKAKASNAHLTYKKHKKIYWAIDHLLPKSLGMTTELAVYLYLIRNRVGYIIPLLLEQRLLGRDDHLIAPDFLVVKKGRMFGIEVEQAAKTGKTRQSNAFMAETGIPVLTASIPNTFPLRCKICHKWILYCNNIIDKFCDLKYKIENDKIPCHSCNQVVYRGRLKRGGKEYHYHLDCVKQIGYVAQLLRKREERRKRLIAYFPYVKGLERLIER